MADVVTPNMGLTLPTVSQTVGPTYAVEINADLSTIDTHNHTPGLGTQVPTSGLNINADLSFNGVNATSLRSARLNPQSSVLSLGTDLRCLYAVNADLYYNDGNGSQIRVTQSGGLAGSPGSISGLSSPASASYNSGNGTFVWQSNTNTSANLDAGSLILRNNIASSNGLTLSPPSISSNYTITLPALPNFNTILAIDTSGNISAPVSLIYPLLSAGIAPFGVARTNLTPVGQQVSSNVSTSIVTQPNGQFFVGSIAATLTTTGRPVMLLVQPGSSVGALGIQIIPSLTSGTKIYTPGFTARYYRDGSPIGGYAYGNGSTPITISSGTGSLIQSFPNSSLYGPPAPFLDVVAAGAHVYQLQFFDSTIGSATYIFQNLSLMAYEL